MHKESRWRFPTSGFTTARVLSQRGGRDWRTQKTQVQPSIGESGEFLQRNRAFFLMRPACWTLGV